MQRHKSTIESTKCPGAWECISTSTCEHILVKRGASSAPIKPFARCQKALLTRTGLMSNPVKALAKSYRLDSVGSRLTCPTISSTTNLSESHQALLCSLLYHSTIVRFETLSETHRGPNQYPPVIPTTESLVLVGWCCCSDISLYSTW